MSYSLSSTEDQVVAALREAADEGGWLWHGASPHPNGEAEFPALILCRGNELVVWAFKETEDPLGPSQRQWLNALSCVPGVRSGVITPSNYDQAVQKLSRRPTEPA